MNKGMLESNIGFKWCDAEREAACAITGEIFTVKSGFSPVLMNVAGNRELINQMINPILLSKYSVPSYIEWKGLCSKHNKVTGLPPAADIVLSRQPLKMSAESTDLATIFRTVSKNIAKKAEHHEIERSVIEEEFKNLGFLVKSSRTGHSFAEDAVRKILDTMIKKPKKTNKGALVQ